MAAVSNNSRKGERERMQGFSLDRGSQIGFGGSPFFFFGGGMRQTYSEVQILARFVSFTK